MNKLMSKLIANESGVTAILVAIMLIVFISIAAFAVDFGYLYFVKNQVQNSADAAALSGADVLFRNAVNPNNFATKGGPVLNTTATCSTTTPITTNAACTAADAIANNEHSTNTFAVNVDLWHNLSPAGPVNPDGTSYPAVQVNLTRTFVPYFFGRVLGRSTTPIYASATAVCRSAATAGIGARMLPIAISKCVFDSAGGFANAVGWTLQVSTLYPHGPPCTSSEWTSLQYNGPKGASYISDVIVNGTQAIVGLAPGAPNATVCQATGADGVNTCILIDDGVKESCFFTIDDYTGQMFAIPVVADVTRGTNQPVEAFVCVELTNACDSQGYFGRNTVGNPKSTETGPTHGGKCPGNDAYVSLTISNANCFVGGTGGGPPYGVTSPPQLGN